jgi:hypothetical protein
MVIGLPAVQPSGAVISETIEEMSEVTRSSCTFRRALQAPHDVGCGRSTRGQVAGRGGRSRRHGVQLTVDADDGLLVGLARADLVDVEENDAGGESVAWRNVDRRKVMPTICSSP